MLPRRARDKLRAAHPCSGFSLRLPRDALLRDFADSAFPGRVFMRDQTSDLLPALVAAAVLGALFVIAPLLTALVAVFLFTVIAHSGKR